MLDSFLNTDKPIDSSNIALFIARVLSLAIAPSFSELNKSPSLFIISAL